MTGQCIDFAPVNQDLHGRNLRDVDRQGVDECVHRQKFVERSALVSAANLQAQVDERVAGRRQIDRLNTRPLGERRREWRRRLAKLLLSDQSGACHRVLALRLGDLVLSSYESQTVLGHVEQDDGVRVGRRR